MEHIVNDELRPGFYRDKSGQWQKERRKSPERRKDGGSVFTHHDRRTLKRRKTDEEILERETKRQIEEAMEDLAAGHEESAEDFAD
jgi:hypothetical protein